MLRLKKLVLKNVGRFSGTHEIDFQSRPNIIQVDAINKNTGGSSGSGKSTIFNAFEYNLGVNPVPTTIMQSRLTKDPLEVIGIYDYNGEEVQVKRGKSLLEITSPSFTVSGNVEEAEKLLDKMIGVPRKLLRNLIHKRQGEKGFFISMTPKECHNFLAECTDLNSWLDKTKKAELDLSESQKKLVHAEAAVRSAQDRLETLEKTIQSIVQPTKPEVVPEAIDRLKSLIKTEEDKLNHFIASIHQETAAIKDPVRPSLTDKSPIQLVEKELAALRSQLDIETRKHNDILREKTSAINSLESKLKTISFLKIDSERSSKELEKIKADIAHVKSKNCPTCKQTWNSGEEDVHLAGLVANARSLFDKIRALSDEISQEPSLTQQIQTLKVDLASIKPDFDGIKLTIQAKEAEVSSVRDRLSREDAAILEAHNAAMLQVNKERTQVSERYSYEIESIRSSISPMKIRLAEASMQLSNYNSALMDYERNTASLQSNIATAKASLDRAIADLASVKNRSDLAASALKLIKSFVNQTFQNTLDTIAFKATEMLSKVPNTATMTVHFEGFKETKSGSVKEEVTAVLNMDGELNVPIKSMSGGESTMVNLAIDLATIDVVEERAGKGMDIFILDEPFDGLDSVCREQCLELLRNSASGKKILIVDHSNETKELVPDRIYVVRDGQNSTVCDTIL